MFQIKSISGILLEVTENYHIFPIAISTVHFSRSKQTQQFLNSISDQADGQPDYYYNTIN